MWTLWVVLLFWAAVGRAGAVDNQIKKNQDQKISELVDEQIQNYLNEVKRTLGLVTEQTKKKRSADFSVGRVYGAEVLSGFQELFVIPSKFPNDILLFSTSKPDGRTSWFAAALESDEESPQTSFANRLVLYNFDGAAWVEFYSVTVNGGISLASLNIQGHVYIVVAEHFAGTSGQLIEGSNVYMFNETSYSLQYVQLLNTKYASDVIMWERADMNEMFVAVTTFQNSNFDESRYSTQSIVYHWLGSHFDIVDHIPTYNSHSIVQFNIGSFMFLAVANFQDNYGNTNIDSEIFRYDLNLGKFITHQKLRTNAAFDIKYFCFESSKKTESFLVVANYFEKDDDGSENYETDSIIYKLSDEEYFIPFQSIKLYAVRKWVPLVQNMGETSAFLLLAVCENGVVAFQYDGWRFVQTSVQYSRSWFGPGVASIRAFQNGNQTVFTVANKNNPGTGVNIFNATFVHDSRMDDFYQGVEEWCEKTLAEVQGSGVEAMVDAAESAPTKNTSEIVLYSNLQFSDVIVNSVKTDSWLTEESNVVDAMTTSLNRLNLELNKPMHELVELERDSEDLFININTIHEKIDLERAVLNCPSTCNFSQLSVGTLNEEDMNSFFHNVILDRSPLLFNELVEFEQLALLQPLETSIVNGHNVDSLVDWSQENVLSYGMVVNGSVTLKSGLSVGGTVDGVVVDESSVWVVGPGQHLPGVIRVQSAGVRSLSVQGSLNGYNVGPNSAVLNREQRVQVLNASSLILTDRLLNGVDFGNLALMALKTEVADQVILGNHFYNRMETANAYVSGMVYLVTEPVEQQPSDIFHNPNEVYMLGEDTPDAVATESPGRSGKLASGAASSTRISVSESVRSAAAEAGIDLDDGDRIESIEVIQDYHFKGNLKVSGTVLVINGSLSAQDLVSTKHNVSTKFVLEKGLRLSETHIPVRMVFDKPFNVKEMSIETINNITMKSLVPTNSSNEVTVTGYKTFLDGIVLEGSYDVVGSVNEVNIKQLVSDTLQTTGDQVINRSWLVGSVLSNTIISKSVYLNDTKWENTTLHKDGLVRLHSVSVEGNVDVDTLTVRGTVAGVDVERMLRDSVFVEDELTTVIGFKNFTSNLSVNKLTTSSLQRLDSHVVTQAVTKSNIWNSSELDLDYPIRVEHLVYAGKFGEIDSSDFGEWLQYEGDQQVFGQQTVRGIHAAGGVVATIINNVNVDRLIQQTRRIDVNETIEHVIFNKNVKSVGPVFIDGKVEGLDLSEEAVLHESHKSQPIMARKTLSSPLTVSGSLLFNGKVNGFDLNKFCVRLMHNSTTLIIKNGSAMFKTEPHISQSVNGYLLNELLDNAWFVNEDITLNHPLQFTYAQFLNITVQGKVNNIALEELSTNYLSKTLNQTWDGDVHFCEGMTVQNTLEAPSATVGNFVSGIRIEQFKDNVLLQGEAQVIDGVLQFGNIEIDGPFRTTGLINGLDLLQDVMRSDIPVNFVTGPKLISKVYALEMDMPPGRKLQDVNILGWHRSAVQTSGNFVIQEEKFFNGPFRSASNIRVEGLVNGVPFDGTHIMHSSSQQTVTGWKIFDETSTVHIKDLELSALLDGINMTEFFSRQMYTNGNATVTGSKTFSNALLADRVYFKGNHNLTEMEQRVRRPLPYGEYHRQVDRLNSVAAAVNRSLQESNAYVRNYTRHLDLEGTVLEAMPVKNIDGEMLLVVTRPHDITRATFSFFKWNSTHKSFNESGNGVIYLRKRPSNLQPINLQNGQRGLIITSELDFDKAETGVAETFLFLHNFTMRRLSRFLVPSKSLVLHFEDRWIKCYVIAEYKGDHCLVYCYTAKKLLHKRPQFQCSNVTQAAVLTTGSGVFVFTLQVNKTVSVHMWDQKYKQLNHLLSLRTLNPVSVDAVSYGGLLYLAVANQHLVGDSAAESVDIYRLDADRKELTLVQQLFSVAPSKIQFSVLPTSELVMYVLSENRATPFSVYVYRGITGFQHLHTDATLPLLTNIASVTDKKKRHFVILTNKVKAMVLQANFA